MTEAINKLVVFTEQDFQAFGGVECGKNLGMPALLGEVADALIIVDTRGITVLFISGGREFIKRCSYKTALHIGRRLIRHDVCEEDLDAMEFEYIADGVI